MGDDFSGDIGARLRDERGLKPANRVGDWRCVGDSRCDIGAAGGT